MKNTTVLAAGFTALLALPALAQQDAIVNPGFETCCGPSALEPKGWHNLSNPNARRRTLTDGQSPTPRVRTGNASIMLGGTTGGFVGFTTDTFDFSTFAYFNPKMDWTQGDLVFRGYYYIPSSAPINDNAGLKFECRLATSQNPDMSKEELLITGHTNDEWRLFELRFTRAEMDARWASFTAGPFYNPGDGFPMQVSLLMVRFGGEAFPVTSGVIFWDDLEFFQEPASTCACVADFDGSGGTPDAGDIDAFFNEWLLGGETADADCSGGTPDAGDIDVFFTQWLAGGC
jgi:hypothetical protein